EVPESIRVTWDARDAGKRAEKKWTRLFNAYRKAFAQEAAEFERRTAGKLPEGFDALARGFLDETDRKAETVATRKASQNTLEVLVPALPELLGGSADLTGSNLTMVKASTPLSPVASGNHIFYGVREFGMCAAMNGIALHGGFIPYGGTFLVFSDYARNALRMAALVELRVG